MRGRRLPRPAELRARGRAGLAEEISFKNNSELTSVSSAPTRACHGAGTDSRFLRCGTRAEKRHRSNAPAELPAVAPRVPSCHGGGRAALPSLSAPAACCYFYRRSHCGRRRRAAAAGREARPGPPQVRADALPAAPSPLAAPDPSPPPSPPLRRERAGRAARRGLLAASAAPVRAVRGGEGRRGPLRD